jgi:hypothetical protein
MTRAMRGFRAGACWAALCTLAFWASIAEGQFCQTADDMDQAVRTGITAAGQKYFDMASKGDVASMQQNAIPSLASDFAGIENVIKQNQPNLAGAQATIKSLFLLDASGPAPIVNADFYCGVFAKNGQTPNSAAFYFNNLPPAKYAVVLVDASSAKGRTMFNEILQQAGTDWKIAGLYVKPAEIAGHDSDWFLAQARQYKAKGQLHNAYMYYLQTIDLTARGMPFMSTLATDKLYDEAQSVQSTDLPSNGKPVDLVANGTTFKLTAVHPSKIGNDLNLFVEYLVPDASNSNQDYLDNFAVMKALLAKYPEFRDAFSGVDALVVDANKRNYGTLLAMKDIK